MLKDYLILRQDRRRAGREKKMLVSGMLSSCPSYFYLPPTPTIPSSIKTSSSSRSPSISNCNTTGLLRIECSSRPKKKATAHHNKTRPKKSQPWDIRRKPTVYAPLPPLPPDWTLFERPDPLLQAQQDDQPRQD